MLNQRVNPKKMPALEGLCQLDALTFNWDNEVPLRRFRPNKFKVIPEIRGN